MKISEIIESRGHKIIANKLKDIEREKRFASGELKIPTPQERKEQEKKDQKKSSVDEAVDPRLIKYEIKGTKENGQLDLFGTTTDFSGSAMKRAIELLDTTKRPVEISTKGYDNELKKMVTVNKVLIKPGDNVKSAVLKLKDNQSVDEGWGAEPAAARHEQNMAAVAKVLQKYQNDPELSKLANYMFQNNWGAASIEKELSGKGQYSLDWWNGRLAKAEKERGLQKDWTQMMVDKYLNK